MTNKKRALVTGLNGFTGHYVAAELQSAGYEVWGIGENSSALPNYVQVDITHLPALQAALTSIQPQVVLHLAGIAFVGNASADAFYQVNLIGTRNLLAALASAAPQVECVLLASSANVYGNSTEGLLDESTPTNPANDYAVSKLAMEMMAKLWMDKLPIVITRPFNYTGVGQTESFLLPKIINHFKRRASYIELGNCDVFRDFSDVRSLAQAYLRLIQAAPAGQTVNVSSGINYSLNQVITMAENIAGYQIEVRINPAFVRANEVRTLLGSSAKLQSIIGAWSSPPLQDTLEWMFHSPLL